jgi:hypothetical protein
MPSAGERSNTAGRPPRIPQYAPGPGLAGEPCPRRMNRQSRPHIAPQPPGDCLRGMRNAFRSPAVRDRCLCGRPHTTRANRTKLPHSLASPSVMADVGDATAGVLESGPRGHGVNLIPSLCQCCPVPAGPHDAIHREPHRRRASSFDSRTVPSNHLPMLVARLLLETWPAGQRTNRAPGISSQV